MGTPSAKQTILLWSLTIVITVSSLIYQRMTGPSRPIRGSIEIAGENIKFKLLRTQFTSSDAKIEIKAPDSISGHIDWRRLNSYDDWISVEMPRENECLVATIPAQPPAGKATYRIILKDQDGIEFPLHDQPVTIRFKGDVPLSVIIPHVFFMFFSMLLSTRAGFEALSGRAKSFRFALWTAVFLFIGGLILGPVVQKFAFDAFWTGWPLGGDLTDNKTALAFIFWLIALWRGRVPGRGKGWYVTASIVMLVVYLIPHSLFGSELDHTGAN